MKEVMRRRKTDEKQSRRKAEEEIKEKMKR